MVSCTVACGAVYNIVHITARTGANMCSAYRSSLSSLRKLHCFWRAQTDTQARTALQSIAELLLAFSLCPGLQVPMRQLGHGMLCQGAKTARNQKNVHQCLSSPRDEDKTG